MTITSQLSQGSTGSQVKELQQFLGISADGIFGPQTAAAVKAYQSSHGLSADGIVGPQTIAKMYPTSTSVTSPSASTLNNPTTPTPNPNAGNPYYVQNSWSYNPGEWNGMAWVTKPTLTIDGRVYNSFANPSEALNALNQMASMGATNVNSILPYVQNQANQQLTQAQKDQIAKNANPTSTSTVSTTQPTTTQPTTPAFSLSSGNLDIGSTGPNVTALQNYLKSQGANITVDGQYGPETQAAVRQFQTNNGITADGIVGPETTKAINYTQTTAGNPNTTTTGDPTADAALAALQKQVDNLKSSGYQIPIGLQITPALVSKFLEYAHAAVDPLTQQYITGAVKDINSNLDYLGKQFKNAQAGTIQQFGTDLATEQNNAGASGTAFSGQRAINENNLAASANRDLESLGNTAAYNIGSALRTGANNVGSQNTGNIVTPDLNTSSVSLGGGQRGTVGPGRTLDLNYDPSLYTVGTIPSDQTGKVNQLQQSYISQYGTLAGNQSNSGRSINDIIKGISGLPANYSPFTL